MVDFLIRWSLNRRVAVLALAALLLAGGAWVASRMPVDVFPDLTAPTVTVLTDVHGMAPTEIESQITFPIETSMNGATGVRRVRSSTGVGLSIVWVEFEWGTDIQAARQVVTEKLSLVAPQLPPDVGRPALAPISSVMGEIMFLAISSDRHSTTALRDVGDNILRRRLLAVPGVSQVIPTGGDRKQFQVVLRPDSLRLHGIDPAKVAEALHRSNETVSAGFLNNRGTEYVVAGAGRLRSLDDIGEVAVLNQYGHPVAVRELGEVVEGVEPKRGEGSSRARPAVVLGVMKQPGANTLAVTAEIDKVLDDIQGKLPQGMTLDRHVMRQADFIEVAVRNVLHALRDGGFLVILVVLLFLANVRATLITLTAIPLSLIAAVLALKAFGATINTMTLGGMAIAVGALVDDAVIDVENVFRRLRENGALPPESRRPVLDVVYSASVEIRSSIVFATFIIVLVFLPLFFLPGVEGRLLQPLGVAYVVALAASLVVAVTVTPALCLILLPKSRAVQMGTEPRMISFLKSAYARVLDPALRFPWVVAGSGALLLIGAIALVPFMGRAFLPEFNEGSLTISVVTMPGTSLAESDELGRAVEKVLLKHPEVKSVARRTGRAEDDEHGQGVEASELDVALDLKGRPKEEFLEALRADFSQVPGTTITIGQPISHRIDHMLSGTRANLAVKIFGDDLSTLRAAAEQVRAAMSGVEGVVDLSVEQQIEIPVLRARFDRAEIRRHSLAIEDVAHSMESALQGLPATRIVEGRKAWDLVVRVEDDEPWSPETLGEIPVSTPGGAQLPLRTLATVSRDSGPNTISREAVERKIVVMCNVSGRDVASVVRDCRKVVDPIVAARTGYRVEYGGQFEAAEEAGRMLGFLGIGVVIAIGLVLHVAFGSFRDAVLVMINLPLALIGGIVGVFVSGGVLSVASLIGFITVFGIAARNGIMLVSHIRHLQLHEGVTDLREAVRKGALERVAPILMTALAAGLGLIPLPLGGGKPGNEIQTPMAIVILCGLFSSMVLNMVVVPALYLRLGKPLASGEPK
jgi:CzcA family heavy metal efflux pump